MDDEERANARVDPFAGLGEYLRRNWVVFYVENGSEDVMDDVHCAEVEVASRGPGGCIISGCIGGGSEGGGLEKEWVSFKQVTAW